MTAFFFLSLEIFISFLLPYVIFLYNFSQNILFVSIIFDCLELVGEVLLPLFLEICIAKETQLGLHDLYYGS